jgi:FlaA1/EpsC-like NDP-sugar epimerase
LQFTDNNYHWERLRFLGTPVLDGAAWAVALFLATLSRYDGDISHIHGRGLLLMIALAVSMQWFSGTALSSYRGRYYPGSLEEACNLAAVAVSVAALLFTINAVAVPVIPRSVPLTAPLIMLALAVGARLFFTTHAAQRARLSRPVAHRVIVFGAGDAGRQLVRSMHNDPTSGYRPVALLDDNPALRRRRISGIGVRGDRSCMATAAAETGADLLVIALPSAGSETKAELAAAASDAGLGVKFLPPLDQLIQPWVGVADLRDLDINDLLGRAPVDTDVATIAGYLQGKKVLVTGAGGSIGSELCRQIHRFEPAELMMLDRDESALHAVQLSITGRALLDSPDVILADIRDAATIHDLFQSRRPDVIFHAAALKHLPMLEQYPEEAWKTNVLGTANVVEAAIASGVRRFVNISTDKAANPISVLGRSKRVGERLVANAARRGAGPFLSVRFGNVLGSRGSVLTTFADQIATGRYLTITHPDVTRFFMTIPEAVELVIQAAAIGRSAEALVLDMGRPVRIVDLAQQLMTMAGRTIPVVFTGLRHGEKLHEELFGTDEDDHRPLHPSISHVAVPPLGDQERGLLSLVSDAATAMLELTNSSVGTRAASNEPVLMQVGTATDGADAMRPVAVHASEAWPTRDGGSAP